MNIKMVYLMGKLRYYRLKKLLFSNPPYEQGLLDEAQQLSKPIMEQGKSYAERRNEEITRNLAAAVLTLLRFAFFALLLAQLGNTLLMLYFLLL